MKVEVYIRNKEIEIPCLYSNQTLYLENTKLSIEFPPLLTYKKVKQIPEEDRKALEVARKLANDGNLKVYDVCSLSGKIMVKIKRIKRIPTVLVEGKEIDWKDFE
ncbi:MAG: hypothetical protein ACP5O8_04385 [Candidatus Aenigmatarchaeota archaeon]